MNRASLLENTNLSARGANAQESISPISVSASGRRRDICDRRSSV